jgi:hypothetical protein
MLLAQGNKGNLKDCRTVTQETKPNQDEKRQCMSD